MTPPFNKSEIDSQLSGVYAEIYAHDGDTPQTIPTGSGYTKSTGFAFNGVSKDATSDASDDKITITKTGTYKVECSLSFTGTGVNVSWFGSVFVGGVEQDKIHFERKIGTGGDYGSTQFGGLIEISAVPVDIDLRFRHDDISSRDLTIRYANFNINRIGIG